MSEGRTLFGKKPVPENQGDGDYLAPDTVSDDVEQGAPEAEDVTDSAHRFNWDADPGPDPFGRTPAAASMDFSWSKEPDDAPVEEAFQEPQRTGEGVATVPDRVEDDQEVASDYEHIHPETPRSWDAQNAAIQSGEAEPGDYVPPLQEESSYAAENTLLEPVTDWAETPVTPLSWREAEAQEIEEAQAVFTQGEEEVAPENEAGFESIETPASPDESVSEDAAEMPDMMEDTQIPYDYGMAGDDLAQPMEEELVAEIAEEFPEDEEPPLDPVILKHEVAELAAAHLLWLQSGGKEGRRANFRGGKFKLADFSGLDLTEANFRGGSLGGALFRGTDLTGADFAEADLQRADLSGANLTGASLQRADIGYANFSDANLTAATMSYITGEGCRFNNALLDEAVLRDAQLTNAIMLGASLREVNLRGATLAGALLENADLTDSDCRQTNFERVRFDGANLSQAQFRGASLTGVDMNATDFTVAIELAPEFHAISMQSERDKLQEEFSQLDTLRKELEIRERKLNDERNAYHRQMQSGQTTIARSQISTPMPDASNLLAKVNRQARWFTISLVVWFLVVVCSVALALSVLEEAAAASLNVMEMGVLAIILLVPLVLFFTSLVKSYDLAASLRRFAKSDPTQGR